MNIHFYVWIFIFLKCNNQEISWNHIINLYECDLGMKNWNPGLRIIHKLTESHIALNPSQGMRVNLAVQVGVMLKNWNQ